MFKKISSFALLFFMLTNFSACRTKSGQTKEPKAKTDAVELVIWNLDDAQEVFLGQFQAYQSKHPNLKISYKKFTDPIEYEKVLLNAIAEGEGPDIMAIPNNWVAKNWKKLAPYPVGGTTIPLNPQIYADTFFNVASQDLVRDGQIYAIPLFIDSLALYYNKQLFRDNIPNSDKPGETWEEIRAQAEMLTRTDNSFSRFALSGIAMGEDNILYFSDLFQALMMQYGVNLWGLDGTKSIIAEKQGIIEGTGKAYYPLSEALSFYTSFAKSNYKNYTWNAAVTADSSLSAQETTPFLRQKVAMFFAYSDMYERLKNMRKQMQTIGESVIKEDDIGVIEFPQILSSEASTKRDAFAKYNALAVSRNSKNADYAWDLIQNLSSKDSLLDYHKKTNKPTSRKDLVDEQMLEPIYGVFARQASYAKTWDIKVNADFFVTQIQNAVYQDLRFLQDLNKITSTWQRRMDCQREKKLSWGKLVWIVLI
ncbi:MAG TPA: extracellular solute-binding protein [Candidatus Gracilibacteria bacterium]|nr:extracellular solute-binding protein [Candidatus Gracilibacteria bacterium]